MRFTKMHGAGNDFIYVNCFEEQVNDPAALARALSDRHFGVGADGLVLVLPSRSADIGMRMFNADGSEAEMCGNGIRCLAKYAFDHDLAPVNPMTVETLAGIKNIELALGPDDEVVAATVDMGEPILEAVHIPVKISAEQVIDERIDVGGLGFHMTCVSMGNPHAVIYMDDVTAVALEEIGPVLECHELFPQRINVHFVAVDSPQEVTMRTWERGSGITLACGTGASAVCVAGVLTERTDREILAHLPGGDLRLRWNEDNNHVYLTGPAVEVFTGEWTG